MWRESDLESGRVGGARNEPISAPSQRNQPATSKPNESDTSGGAARDDAAANDHFQSRAPPAGKSHEAEGACRPACGDKLAPLAGRESAQNLDSGYAWCILAVMFLIQSSISGCSRVYGIVYAKEVAVGYYDREQASWPIATASAVENLASILTPALAGYLSWRKIELLSTCLFISSNLLAYFSSSLALDILALGLVQGLALATSTPLSLAINNDYFERYRTTAYGVAMSGSTFGVLYLSPLVGWLLTNYDDFRLVYLALAGVFSINILLVLFIKPRAKTINKSAAEQQQQQQKPVDHANEAGLAAPWGAPQPRLAGQTGAPQSVVNCLPAGKQIDPNASGARDELRRKRSRLESHFFGRKDSIASISYSVRSRRQSILSRNFDLPAVAAGSSAGAGAAAGNKPRRVFSQRECSLDQDLRRDSDAPEADNELGRARQALAKSSSIGANLFFKSMAKKASVCSSTNSTGADESQLATRNALATHDLFLIDTTGDSAANADQQHQQQPAKPWALARQASSRALQQSVDGGRELEAAQLEREISLALAQLNDCGAQTRDRLATTKGNHPLAFEASATPAQAADGATQAPPTADIDEFSLATILRLARVPYLHCAWIMLALYYLVARIFIIILVDFCDDHGFSLAQSTSLLNYWSLGELLGRVLLGSIIDLNWLSCRSCIALTCSLLSGAIVLMVLVESYPVYAACSLLIAALISLEYMLINVLMVEYLGKKCVTSCYSLAACISSLVLFARPTLIGLFRDQLGSYDGLLLLLAACSLAYALLFRLLEPLFVRRWPKLAPL